MSETDISSEDNRRLVIIKSKLNDLHRKIDTGKEPKNLAVKLGKIGILIIEFSNVVRIAFPVFL